MTEPDAVSEWAVELRRWAGDWDSLYGVAARAMADDVEAGGVVRTLCPGWHPGPEDAAVHLRILAAVFREVLGGRAPELVPFYACLGGSADPGDVWPTMRAVIARSADRIRASLDTPPQTNEVGRSAALVVGLFEAVERTGLARIRLLELGASAGLNLNVEHFTMVGDGWARGRYADAAHLVPPDDVRLEIGAAGADPVGFEIVTARGCDLDPVDALTPDGALWLTSFVWPWQVERHDRLGRAIELARRHPVVVDRAAASTWLAEQLRDPVDPGLLTVVWHSVTRMYWPPAEVEAVQATIDDARSRMPIAHIAMEHEDLAGDPTAVVTLDGEALATAGDHGPPVVLVRR